jgi:hypothetical protein
LQKKDVNIEFNKPNKIGIKEYNYEWKRTFHTIFSEIVTELGIGKECSPTQCPKITAGPKCEYVCMNYGGGKHNFNCCAIDYCIHTLDTNSVLLTHPAYFSNRDKISGHSASVLIKMVRYLYRMLAHIYFHHRKLFDSLEYGYRIGGCLTLYCKKFNIIDKPKEYCIKT